MKQRNSFPLSVIIAVIFGIVPLFAEETEMTWNWKPSWFDKGDCGPNALYVLMNLYGKKITIQEVKKHLPFDPVKGCTLEAMQRAAAELGFPVKTLFVKPSDISKVPRPFIIHGITSKEQQLGHFIVVVDFEPDKQVYQLIDPVRETYTRNPESSLLYNFSGYVIVPAGSPVRLWNNLSGIILMIAVLYLIYTIRLKVNLFKRRRT